MHITPYARLVTLVQLFLVRAFGRKTQECWTYDKEAVNRCEMWRLDVLRAAVQTAKKLGYETLLVEKDGNLQVLFREELSQEWVEYKRLGALLWR